MLILFIKKSSSNSDTKTSFRFKKTKNLLLVYLLEINMHFE